MKNRPSPLLIVTAVAVALTFPHVALASDWTGGTANWSSNSNPGWNGTGVPNAVGAVANYGVNGSSNTIVDSNYTVGTISYTTQASQSWTIIPDGTSRIITLNQDGAGSSSALISNANLIGGSSNALSFKGNSASSTLTLNLADNLTISNAGAASTSGNGSIEFGTNTIISGTGNITLTNNEFNITTDGAKRTILFQGGVNTFVGTVSVVKGSVTFNNGNAFGAVATNVITLGSSGAESASLLAFGNGMSLANNWQTAAGNTGSLVIGKYTANTTTTNNFNGTGTLNSNLTLLSNSTGAGLVTLGGVVSGTGGITTIGTGATSLTKANTYSGDTKVNSATLQLDNNLALQNSAYDTSGSGVILLKTGGGAVTTPTFGGLIGSKDLATAITTGYSAVTSLTLNPNTGKSYDYSGIIANGAMTLTKSGGGTQILSGANSYSGATTISGGTLLLSGSNSGVGLVTVQTAGALGGDGSVAGSLTLDAGADFVFSLTDTLTINGANVTFGGFSITDLIGLNSSVATGTYTLMDGAAVFSYTNVNNFGLAKAYSLGGGKSAYFQGTGLQVVVVPEPNTYVMMLGGLGMMLLLRRRRRSF